MRWIRPRWRDLAWPPQPFERYGDVRPLFSLLFAAAATVSATTPGPFLQGRWTLVLVAALVVFVVGWWLLDERRLIRRLGGREQRTLLRSALKQGQLPEGADGERWLPYLGGRLLGWSATMNRNLWLMSGAYSATLVVVVLGVESPGRAAALFGLGLVGGTLAGGIAAPYERRRIESTRDLRQQIVAAQRGLNR